MDISNKYNIKLKSQNIVYYLSLTYFFLLGSARKFFLITPTATVLRISRTANRPRGGYSLKLSTHIGLDGIISTITACPDLADFGFCSITAPVLLFIRVSNLSNRQAMW